MYWSDLQSTHTTGRARCGKTNDHQILAPVTHRRPRPEGRGEKRRGRGARISKLKCGGARQLLKDEKFNEPTHIRLIELVMPRDDAPEALIKQAKLTAEANAGA